MSFWNDLAVYCEHLAPCATPAVATIGQVANAMSTAERHVTELRSETSRLQSHIASFDSIPLLSEEDFCD